ncbi:hypothetical protein PVAND_005639 [Polypedilum vanderplanki]|uniref:Homeobox domain-containing protein n=1 Tax=Polypedilum vanderplanki TaxID=319348 RepID=A0A9J6C176_POLVA|nr:hypothetical protein PVAND_005639 [Polypedilum vanderplanki]
MRPIRIRKHSRKSWTQNGSSTVKRLFTPEIKKMLKEWLIRRRDNPYPSREEKKALAQESGLTYTQVCNWFANWRRKLKNTSTQKKSWGNLIKNYNFNAKGNVEQFSISSEDSIWNDGNKNNNDIDSLDSFDQNSDSEVQDLSKPNEMHFDDHQFKAALTSMAQHVLPNAASFFNPQNSTQFAMNFLAQAQQCFQISSTTNCDLQQNDSQKQYFANSNKFKNHIMEKYLRGLDDETNNNVDMNKTNNSPESATSKKPELSKWLTSSANFQPSSYNYNIDFAKNEKKKKCSKSSATLCEKELIAAETLVLLKNNFRTKFYNS